MRLFWGFFGDEAIYMSRHWGRLRSSLVEYRFKQGYQIWRHTHFSAKASYTFNDTILSFIFSLLFLLLGFPVIMSLKVPSSLASTLSHALSHTNTISKMDTRYTFTSTIKDYDNNKKQVRRPLYEGLCMRAGEALRSYRGRHKPKLDPKLDLSKRRYSYSPLHLSSSQEILNVITPDGKTVETKKPYKSQFTVKTPKGPYERWEGTLKSRSRA